MAPDTQKLLRQKFPFLTIVSYLGTQHIGIMQNSDSSFISIYLLDPGFTGQMKLEFLQCGETWWWESNRTIPINLFLRERFKPFKPWLKTFSRKEAEIIEGPSVSLMDLVNRRLKKRTIQLVRSAS